MGIFRKKQRRSSSPDFSHLDSQEEVERAHQAGTLEKLYLMPLAFGGQDTVVNVVYVPLGLAAVKHSMDMNVIAKLIDEGTVSQYSATPRYQGKSFVPIAIDVRAWNPGEFTTTIKIWGDALEEN